MAPNIIVLPIGAGSDGDGGKRPAANLGFTHNDQYYLERVATEKWIKDLPGGARPGVRYQLDRLPAGYAGFEKARPGTSHIDRYLYGHPNGAFRSLNEFYPHFKHLMDHQDAQGCQCKLCTTGSSRRKPGGGNGDKNSATSGSPVRQSPFFAQPQKPHVQPTQTSSAKLGPPLIDLDGFLQGKPDELPLPAPRKKQVDEEGTTDVYRKLLDKLQEAGPEGTVNERIVESMSPDWRACHELLEETCDHFLQAPSYAPRHGELVMFVRYLKIHDTIGWDHNARTWRVLDLKSNQWMERAHWEAGVVTQTPTEAVTAAALAQVPAREQKSINYTGYRIEPMPKPGSVTKTHTKQYKYVPLHAIRPFSLWQDCIGKASKDRANGTEYHPTVNHALILASSFSILCKFHFKGSWPEASIFAKGVFIGSELLLVGDTVRLQPRPREQRADAVTDVLVITAIKLKFVNLEEASNDDFDEGRPYNTCLHVSGKAYTLDPSRSYDGVGKLPIQDSVLSPGMMALGQWYHMLDPKKPKLRLEIPYHRILSRCYEKEAITSWYTVAPGAPPIPTTTSFQSVNDHKANPPSFTVNGINYDSISHGLRGVQDARAYSMTNDVRIDQASGKTWFWADTRVEQLDLHEVNGKHVGIKDDTRSSAQMDDWRKALKALDGKGGDLSEYHAVRKEKEKEWAKKIAEGSAGMGMGIVASAVAQTAEAEGSGSDNGAESDGNGMETGTGDDEAMDVDRELLHMSENADESDVEMTGPQDALATFKAGPEGRRTIKSNTVKKEDVISLLEHSDEDR